MVNFHPLLNVSSSTKRNPRRKTTLHPTTIQVNPTIHISPRQLLMPRGIVTTPFSDPPTVPSPPSGNLPFASWRSTTTSARGASESKKALQAKRLAGEKHRGEINYRLALPHLRRETKERKKEREEGIRERAAENNKSGLLLCNDS